MQEYKTIKLNKLAKNKMDIPIFFATDDNYVPHLTVALSSILENSSKKYNYKIHILTTELKQENYDVLNQYNQNNMSIRFVNVTKKLDKVSNKLFLRDYYSKATYYRFFIAELFPEYSKALYLDCDIVVLGDIAELYNHNLKNNYVGAVCEDIMLHENIFGTYVEKGLNISRYKYFNAGVLLLNLNKFRSENVENKFIELISKYKFEVTQDQDYLNVICKDKVLLIANAWNKTPIANTNLSEKDFKIMHFKIANKPWRYFNIPCSELFWKYAKLSHFENFFLNQLNTYTDAKRQFDLDCYNTLKQTALDYINNPNNYKNSIEKLLNCNNMDFNACSQIVEQTTFQPAETLTNI